MNRTTRTISLALISSALVFLGWGCPLAHDEEADNTHHSTGYQNHRYGHTMFWFYGGGYRGPIATGPGPGPGSAPAGHSGSVSSRGGFGGSGGPAVS